MLRSRLQTPEARSLLLVAGIIITIIAVPHFIHNVILYHSPWNWHKPVEESNWIATSHSWVDRTLCHWAGFCGLAHIALSRGSSVERNRAGPFGKGNSHKLPSGRQHRLDATWHSGGKQIHSSSVSSNYTEVPQFVLDYAPLVHLYSGERFWPGDLAEHLEHTRPLQDYSPLIGRMEPANLSNLDQLNKYSNGKNIFLTSKDDPETIPDWLGGARNIPKNASLEPHHLGAQTSIQIPAAFAKDDAEVDSQGNDEDWTSVGDGDQVEEQDNPEQRPSPAIPIKLPAPRSRSSSTPKKGGRSTAPALLIVVPKDNDVVDAFWFFFYSFNLGNKVFNTRFGNHVGDWEHSMVRFHRGVPKAVYLSEHEWGQAYTYDAVEKSGSRPVIYSASGSHAMYAVPGIHPYALPWGILKDVTDEGPLWDPAQNVRSFVYDYRNDALRASQLDPDAPTEWFHFAGRWGDKYYPLGDKRQYRLVGEYHYVSGPEGPKFKKLGRQQICQARGRCYISKKLHR